MKIKQLTWEITKNLWHRARTPFSWAYWIAPGNSPKGIRIDTLDGEHLLDFIVCKGSIEEAKAAVQADFEQRVMACFETTDKSNFWG